MKFILLDPHISNAEVFTTLSLLLVAIAQVITVLIFSILDLTKKKFSIGLGIYWCLLLLLITTCFPLFDDDGYDKIRIGLFFTMFIYFFGYFIFRIVRRKNQKNKIE